MTDIQKQNYLVMIEQEKSIITTLEKLHKELIFVSNGRLPGLARQASDLISEISKMNKGIKRMKVETAEKRLSKLVASVALLKTQFINENQVINESEYLSDLKKEVSSTLPGDVSIVYKGKVYFVTQVHNKGYEGEIWILQTLEERQSNLDCDLGLAVLKKVIEIPTANDKVEPKKVTEIKPEEKRKMTKKKKEAEIKGEQLSISIRGGARKGAGRKSIGVKKPVSIVLPQEAWDEIESLIKSGEYESYAQYFRAKSGWS